MTLSTSSLLALAIFALASASNAARITCLSDPAISTLEELVACYVKFAVPENYYTAENGKYCSAQPSYGRENIWPDTIQSFASSMWRHVDPPAKCPPKDHWSGAVFPLSAFETGEFEEDGKTYCIVAEKFTDANDPNVFALGWGVAIFPAFLTPPPLIAPHLYFFVPHPVKSVARQATALYKRLNGRVLLINGRHPRAIRMSTTCVKASNDCDVYHATDPIYDKDQPFSKAMQALWVGQLPSGCPMDRCGYLQFIAKQSDVCPQYKVFLSNGLGNSPGSDAWYANPSKSSARRLKTSLDQLIEPYIHVGFGLPAEADSCALTKVASDNVFGRDVNYNSNVCNHEVTVEDLERVSPSGNTVKLFVEDFLASPIFDDEWAKALREAFKWKVVVRGMEHEGDDDSFRIQNPGP